MWNPPWELKMYLPENKGGELLLHLWFTAEHSFQMDLDVALKRRERGEVGMIYVLTPGKGWEQR